MSEGRYRKVFAQFLNDYWGAFHEVLEAQSVNHKVLAPSLFDAVVDAHKRFAKHKGLADPAVARLGRLWAYVTQRRTETPHAPLTAREIAHARALFEIVHDTLIAQGRTHPHVCSEVLLQAAHRDPRSPLRADAMR